MDKITEGLLRQNKVLIAENKELKEKLEPFRKVEADNKHLLNILHGNSQ